MKVEIETRKGKLTIFIVVTHLGFLGGATARLASLFNDLDGLLENWDGGSLAVDGVLEDRVLLAAGAQADFLSVGRLEALAVGTLGDVNWGEVRVVRVV